MKKNNNKGFMLTELLVTATLICTVLIFLYTQFYNVKKGYDRSFNYNTVNGLYILDNVKKFLIENDLSVFKLQLNNKNYVELTETENISLMSNQDYFNKMISFTNIKKLYFTKENLESLKNELNLNPIGKLESLRKFVNYIDYDSNAGDNLYRLIAEFNDSTFSTILLGGE